MHSVCEHIKFADEGAGQIVGNFLRVIALNSRLCALTGILHAFQRRVALSRGEVSAQIVSARPLNPQQEKSCAWLWKVLLGENFTTYPC